MIPRSNIRLSAELPAQAKYWVPSREDIDPDGRDGIGFFRDVWLIINVDRAEAMEIADNERQILRIIDELAQDAETFEELAGLVEAYYPEDVEFTGVSTKILARLDPYLDEFSPLHGLELGVSGLCHTLASVGCVPVASCRSHTSQRCWADRPVVYVALDRPHAQWLQPIVHPRGMWIQCRLGATGLPDYRGQLHLRDDRFDCCNTPRRRV